MIAAPFWGSKMCHFRRAAKACPHSGREGQKCKSGWAARHKPQAAVAIRRRFARSTSVQARVFRAHGQIVNRLLQTQHGCRKSRHAAAQPFVQFCAQRGAAIGLVACHAHAMQGRKAAQRPGGRPEHAGQVSRVRGAAGARFDLVAPRAPPLHEKRVQALHFSVLDRKSVV